MTTSRPGDGRPRRCRDIRVRRPPLRPRPRCRPRHRDLAASRRRRPHHTRGRLRATLTPKSPRFKRIPRDRETFGNRGDATMKFAGAAPLLHCVKNTARVTAPSMCKCASLQAASNQYPVASISAAENTGAGHWILTVYTFANFHTFARSARVRG